MLQLRLKGVGLEGAHSHLENAHGDVGAVVGNALKICEDVGKDETKRRGAFTALQTADVAVTKRVLQIVHDLLQRVDAIGRGDIQLGEGANRKRRNFADCAEHDFKLSFCIVGK